MLYEYRISTPRAGFYDITPKLREAIDKSEAASGRAIVYCPHTTAGITINENADPDVARDIFVGLDKAFPDRPEFCHAEGNSAAHIKASVIGSSAVVIIRDGKPLLGTWQGVYFCEFDSPRERTFFVEVSG